MKKSWYDEQCPKPEFHFSVCFDAKPLPMRKPSIVIVLFAFSLVLPSLIWAVNNPKPWVSSDNCSYGLLSIRLFRILVNDPLRWTKNLFSISRDKAPLIVWLGEFF